jgi:hypothetical protein
MKKSIYAITLISLSFSCNKNQGSTIDPIFNETKSVYVGTTHLIAVDLVPTKGYVQTDSFYVDTIKVTETMDSIFMSNFLSGFKKNDMGSYIVSLPHYSSIVFKFKKPDSIEFHFSNFGQCGCPWKRETIFKGEKL